MRQLFVTLLTLGLLSTLHAQNNTGFWKSIPVNDVVLPAKATRLPEPVQYFAFQIDYNGLTAALAQAPMEFSANAAAHPCVLSFPQADGTFEAFSVVKISIMMPKLAAKYPEICTYEGSSMVSPGKKIRITCSPYRGFEAMIRRADKGVEYLEPIAAGQQEYYMAYDRRNATDGMGLKLRTSWIGLPEGMDIKKPGDDTPRFSPGEPTAPGTSDRNILGNPVDLKIYRFACATTGEFSVDNGGTTPLVLAKIVDLTNKLNTIYETDLDIRLKLIDEEETILFLDPTTDPYTGTEVGNWLDQNPLAMVQKLGSADKYDIGHVFARYISGNAAGVAGGLCCTQSKGRGCSSANYPYGDYFLSIAGQEIGHQWSAGHTWNHCSANNQYSYESSCEPGSGSTIMSYAGACPGDDIQGSADLYYQACSIFQIRRFVETGEGATCGSTQSTGNTAPIVTIPLQDNFFIPISTPFELNGSAMDMDGDPMTYNWDEIDVDVSTPLGMPVGTSPLFRSYPPGPKTNRVFPRIQDLVNNVSSNKEVLPTYSRDLTFCMLARDNRPGGGGLGLDTVAFKSTNLAGPFYVLSPNTSGTVWNVGEYHDVIWDVANTDKAPVNCKNVNIRMSTDGGFTYPVTLAASVPNTGKHCVLVPSNVTNTARIRVEAADNIFFDISNTNLKIQPAPQPGFSICTNVQKDYICLPGSYSATISTAGFSNFTTPITLSTTGLPNGATASFSPNPVTPGSDAVMTIDFQPGSGESVFALAVNADAAGTTATTSVNFTVISNDFSALAMQSPANGASGVDLAPVLHWHAIADANLYDLQIASSPSFASDKIIASKSGTSLDSFKMSIILNEGQTCYWRVRGKNECGDSPWLDPFVFVTKKQSCNTFSSNDLPKAISASSTPTIESKIVVNSSAVLGDVNVKSVAGNHTYFKDLEAHLISPTGTDVLLWKDKCPGGYTFDIGFDDSAPNVFGCPPPSTGAKSKPVGSLATMIGQNSNGTWTLRVKDNVISSGGQLTGFQLELCTSVTLSPPYIINNNILSVAQGNNAGIGSDLLKAGDANNSADQLTYTLMTVPKYGLIQHAGLNLQPGDQFTQAEIDNGQIHYFDFGVNTGTDEFSFAVSDGEGGLVSGKFLIKPLVGTQEITRRLGFALAPNPANETVRLTFREAVTSDTRVSLFDMAGRQIRNWSLGTGTTSVLLNISELPEGIYAVSVENSNGKDIRKLVVR